MGRIYPVQGGSIVSYTVRESVFERYVVRRGGRGGEYGSAYRTRAPRARCAEGACFLP